MSKISNIIQFLQQSESNFITITNQENGLSIGKNAIYLVDIPNKNLERYIKAQLGDIDKPTLVWIETRIKNGATSKKGQSYKIEVMPPNYQEPVTQLPAPQNYAPAVVPTQEPQPSFLGAPALGNNIFGLGFPEIMKMQRNADQLEEKKEQLAEIKEENRNLKHKYDALDIEHRGLLTKLSIAESQKEMAVAMVKLENKSFADSPAFQTLMDQAPNLISAVMAAKSGGAVPAAGLGQPGASAVHNEFFEYANDHLTEGQMNYLGSICQFMNNPEFLNDLKLLISRYATS